MMNIFFDRFPVQIKFKFSHNIDPVPWCFSFVIYMFVPGAVVGKYQAKC